MRDYKKEPLKHGEEIEYKEIYELYINHNFSRKELQNYFNVGRTKILQTLKKYKIQKTEEQKKLTQLQSNLRKYNTTHPRLNKEYNDKIVQKTRETCLKKYGVDNIAKLDKTKEKIKKTCKEKYGYNYISQSPEFRIKVTKTNLERYKAIDKLTIKEGIEKKTKEWLKNLKINIEYKNIEIINNKEKNTYKTEEYIYNKLMENFGYVKRNYKCERYPFHVNFYIPIIDTFIEYQGFKGHGNHPFNYNNPNDINILLTWAKKADEKKIDKRNKYLSYIATWVEKDPMKREIAKRNKLNWLEFFTKEEFNFWIRSY